MRLDECLIVIFTVSACGNRNFIATVRGEGCTAAISVIYLEKELLICALAFACLSRVSQSTFMSM